MTSHWSTAQLEVEVDYLIKERLGILCGVNKPTFEQLALARKEAQEWVESMTEQPMLL